MSMSTIYIRSEDIAGEDDTVSDGSFNLSKMVGGPYHVRTLNLSSSGQVAWMNDGMSLVIGIKPDPLYTNQPNPEGLIICFLTDLEYEFTLANIASNMEDQINHAISSNPDLPNSDYLRTITVTANTSSQTLVISANKKISLKWTSIYSTINESFGKPYHTKASDENNVYSVTVSTKYITQPEFLEMYIDESTSKVVTTHETLPTLILDLTGGDMSNQAFNIFQNTRVLHVSIYRPNIKSVPIRMTKSWNMTFT